MTNDILVCNVDFELLNDQRNALLVFLDGKPLENDTAEGLVAMMHDMLDSAEEEGYFVFPEIPDN